MNFYETLGLASSATAEEIKKAYRNLAKRFHPDTNPGNLEAEQKFKAIAEAYEVLGDPQKKAHYDARLNRPSMGGLFDDFDFIGENLFGSSNLHVDIKLNIPFLDCRYSHPRNITFNRDTVCNACSGSGGRTFNNSPCATCRGAGTLNHQVMGFFTAVQVCPTCNGRGRQILEPCSVCYRKGLVSETTNIKITVPAGVYTGQILKVTGEGHRHQKGRGDLRISILVDMDPRWAKREGSHIWSTVAVPYSTLVLGGTVNVETIWGLEQITIPARSKCGQTVNLINKGFPRFNGLQSDERGNHYVTFDLEMPNEISQEHQELLQRLAAIAKTG